MRNFILLLVVVASLGLCQEIGNDCLESDDSPIEECVETEYQSYIECVRRRTKRHVSCNQAQSCDSCDCEYCSSNYCSNQCNTCCANFQQPCQTKYCCYKTCHSQCSSHGCRDSCRRSCTNKLTEDKPTPVQSVVPNITTIINLHNKINTTNIIDVPINLKTDNINNITINTADYAKNSSEQCCQIVSPRQCTPIKEYPFMKCFHLRKRVCSNLCRSDIMHAQPHQICDQRPDGPPDCHNQIIYVPQPQPRCVYKSEWPYVSCNIPEANCDGCYGHYLSKTSRPANCPNSCYDDGYGVGPYYRQGPFYRPGFAPVPSCAQMGTCPPYSGYGYPMGGFDPMFAEQNSLSVPFSAVGYPPSTYDNFFTANMEVSDLSKLFSNSIKNDDYDAQTLPITNSITQLPPTHVEPRLVKIETVNATDVLMTIKEMNDGVPQDVSVSVTTTSSPSTAFDPAVQASQQNLLGSPPAALNPSLSAELNPALQSLVMPFESEKQNPYFAGLYDPVVRYQRDHNKVKKDSSEQTDTDEHPITATEFNHSDIVRNGKKASEKRKHSRGSLAYPIPLQLHAQKDDHKKISNNE